jgi:hypothetical protein
VEKRSLSPQVGDVLLRGDGYQGFELVRAVTLEPIQSHIPTLEAVVEVARANGAGAIWQQSFDNRGRALGDAVRLFHIDTKPTGTA